MKEVLLVTFGGGLGALARFKLSGFVLHSTPAWKFPLGTFVVNVLGCLVAGVLIALAEKLNLFGPEARLFLFTGILGGFTTFSAFGVETIALLRKDELQVAALYVGLSVVCGLIALWAALRIVEALVSPA